MNGKRISYQMKGQSNAFVCGKNILLRGPIPCIYTMRFARMSRVRTQSMPVDNADVIPEMIAFFQPGISKKGAVLRLAELLVKILNDKHFPVTNYMAVKNQKGRPNPWLKPLRRH